MGVVTGTVSSYRYLGKIYSKKLNSQFLKVKVINLGALLVASVAH